MLVSIMFKFLKDRLSRAVSSFSKKAAEAGEEDVLKEEEARLRQQPAETAQAAKTEEAEDEREKKEELAVDEELLEEEESVAPEAGIETVMEREEAEVLEQELLPEKRKEEEKKKKEGEKQGFFSKLLHKKKPEEARKGIMSSLGSRLTTARLSQKRFDELFGELELVLLENNVAVPVIEKLKDGLQAEMVDVAIKRAEMKSVVLNSLKKSIEDLFDCEPLNILEMASKKKPFVICFVGINGSGKTTTIAKVAQYFIENSRKVVLAAADTFRAAAIDQLTHHADRLGVKIIKHDYGSDPAAVAFDAIQHAKAHFADVVLIDTAGRMHSNENLIEEMKKIIRVARPDLKIFVGEAITGNDCIEQASTFHEAIGIDGIVLAKADVDEKGGAAVSVSYVTKRPILFLGTGQKYADLQPFSKEMVLRNLGLEA